MSIEDRETELLDAAVTLDAVGYVEFHGIQLASEVSRAKHKNERAMLMPIGTLYRALSRLEDTGKLASRWEDQALADQHGRPKRRLYHLENGLEDHATN